MYDSRADFVGDAFSGVKGWYYVEGKKGIERKDHIRREFVSGMWAAFLSSLETRLFACVT